MSPNLHATRRHRCFFSKESCGCGSLSRGGDVRESHSSSWSLSILGQRQGPVQQVQRVQQKGRRDKIDDED